MSKKTKETNTIITSEMATAAIQRANKKLKHQSIDKKLKHIQKSLLNTGIHSSVHLTHSGRVIIKTNIFSDPSEFYSTDRDKIPQK